MTESFQANHPLVPDLLLNRDSFVQHLNKILFLLGDDPHDIPRMRVWIGACHKAADNCRQLGHTILTGGGEFTIRDIPAASKAVEDLFQWRKKRLSEVEGLLRASEWPSCRLVPGGGLIAHENSLLRFHTLDKHVGKTNKDLAELLQANKNRKYASTFSDRATAESAIAKALLLSSEYITAKFAKGKKVVEIPNGPGGIDLKAPVGFVLTRDGKLHRTTRVRIILHRAAVNGPNFRIKTAYPIL